MSIQMSEESRQNIKELETQMGHATGMGAIDRGQCPIGARSPMGCMFCSYGHMLECHYPKTCEEAECSHYKEELAAEYQDIDNEGNHIP